MNRDLMSGNAASDQGDRMQLIFQAREHVAFATTDAGVIAFHVTRYVFDDVEHFDAIAWDERGLEPDAAVDISRHIVVGRSYRTMYAAFEACTQILPRILEATPGSTEHLEEGWSSSKRVSRALVSL